MPQPLTNYKYLPLLGMLFSFFFFGIAKFRDTLLYCFSRRVSHILRFLKLRPVWDIFFSLYFAPIITLWCVFVYDVCCVCVWKLVENLWNLSKVLYSFRFIGRTPKFPRVQEQPSKTHLTTLGLCTYCYSPFVSCRILIERVCERERGRESERMHMNKWYCTYFYIYRIRRSNIYSVI